MNDQAQQVKFYTDTHIAKAVSVQLRLRGIDVVRCEEIGMATASDVEHLEYAAKEGRIVITNDDDFSRLSSQWINEGKHHSGIMYCLSEVQGEAAIGIIVKECIDLHELIKAGAGTLEADVVDQVFYVR